MMVWKRGERSRFTCMNRHLRGRAVCENNLAVLLDDADGPSLDAIESSLLDVEACIETAMVEGAGQLRGRADAGCGGAAPPRPDHARPRTGATGPRRSRVAARWKRSWTPSGAARRDGPSYGPPSPVKSASRPGSGVVTRS